MAKAIDTARPWPFLAGSLLGLIATAYIAFIYLPPLLFIVFGDWSSVRPLVEPVMFAWFGVAGVLPPIIAVILAVYRGSWRRTQTRLNDDVDAVIHGEHGFSLYLRPFVTSGRLKVPNAWRNLGQRVLLGDPWDLELALATLLNPSWPMVAIGHQARAMGAMKVKTSDADWQAELLRLAAAARCIVCIPLDRPSTQWEVETLAGNPDLLGKTVFAMPPSSRFYDVLLFLFRPSLKSRWRRSRATLAERGIALPAYRRRGGFFVLGPEGSSGLASLRSFRPGYVQRLLAEAAEPRSDRVKWFTDAYAGFRWHIPRLLPGLSLVGLFNPYVFKFFVLGVLAVLLPRTFVGTIHNVTNGSMLPYLGVGDVMVTSKLAYGYSSHSFRPLILDIDTLHRSGPGPAYGDVVTYYTDADDVSPYAKRVVGLPGDRIAIKAGQLIINGRPVPLRELPPDPADLDVVPYAEVLPNGVSYTVWRSRLPYPELDDMAELTIPARRFFVIGDSRSNSWDSRSPTHGLVDLERILGPVVARIDLFREQ